MITRLHRFRHFAWLFLVVLLCGGAAAQAADQQRIALVIGNADYPDASAPVTVALKNARAVAEQLRKSGFEVDLAENLNKDPLQRAVQAFYDKIKPGAAVVVFFSGYGIQATRQNFLIPLNALIWTELDVRRDGVSIEAMLNTLGERGASTRILILDASRRNPFERRFRSYSAGLGTIETPTNTIVISAAGPGRVISDADADSSIFVTELLKEMSAPGIPVVDVFNRTREGVSRATSDQMPWVASNLTEKFYFGKPPSPQQLAQPASPPPPPPPRIPQQTVEQAPQQPPRPPPVEPPRGEGVRPKIVDRKPGEAFRDCPTCPELIVVPAGEYDMGSNDLEPEKPIHRVSISKPFAVGRRELTFAEWDQCVSAGACKARPDDAGRGRADLPVGGVSWNDAQDYVNWLSAKTGARYRLPSEAEWEYVARGGTTTPYWWGPANKPGQANCRDCGGPAAGQSSSKVGGFAANGFGLYDTAGNVAEWVEDCWNPNYRAASADGTPVTTGQCRLRVLRGGSYENMSRYIRSSSRFLYDASVRYAANGFRVLRELP